MITKKIKAQGEKTEEQKECDAATKRNMKCGTADKDVSKPQVQHMPNKTKKPFYVLKGKLNKHKRC